MFFLKSLKLVLPLATATAATIVTASLVSFRKEDLKKQELNEDKLLNDIEISVEEFKEETKFYTEKPEEEGENKKDLTKEKEKEEKGIKSLKEVEEVFHNTVELMKKAQTADKVDEMNIQLPTQLSSEALTKEKETLEQTAISKEELAPSSNGDNQEGTNFGAPSDQEEAKEVNDIQPTMPETELRDDDAGTLAEATPEWDVQSSESPQFESVTSEESQSSQEKEVISEGSGSQTEEREQISKQLEDSKLSERDFDSASENSTMTLEQLNELLALHGKLSKSFNELGDLVRSFE